MPGFVSPFGLSGLRKVLLVSGMFEEFAFPSTAESPRRLLGVIAGPLPLELLFSEFAVEVEDIHLHQSPRGSYYRSLGPHSGTGDGVEAFLRAPWSENSPQNIL